MSEKKLLLPYQKPFEDVARFQSVDVSNGLSNKDVVKRIEKYGPNELKAKKGVSPIRLFINQFKDILVFVLIAAATTSLVLHYVEGESTGLPTEALLIYAIIVAIAVVGFLNEYKAERTVEALKKLVSHNAKVLRDGRQIEIQASELVPGDIVIISEGDKVAADIRLFQAKALKANEASLTGESTPVSKTTDAIVSNCSLGDRTNMLFSGTIVNSGSARGIVVATASISEIGKIAGLVDSVEEDQTPMQKKLNQLGRQLGAGIVAICVVVFVAIFFMDDALISETLLHRLILAFTAAVALAVAAIPEGLAFVVRISLALGARRMATKNALVRRLSAVEALGSTDVICSDKTGTLTKGEMTVRKLWQVDATSDLSGTGYGTKGEFSGKIDDFKQMLKIGAVCNDAKLRDGGKIIGDPTEAALLVSAAKAGIKPELERINEAPFNSERKMMSTVHKDGNSYLIATKGAVEKVLAVCDYVLENGRKVEISKEYRKQILDANKELAQQALRVLAVAYRESTTEPKEADIEEGLIFVGLQGMMDPPREEVVEVIHRVQTEAGMRVVMITGDYVETAKAVAKEIGLSGEAISGVELDKLTDKQFAKKVEEISVYARVNPEHKIKIVQALKAHGHQVAMTGDGVNDSPAIKAADIGIAMGITGTDATKEAADLILLDDQFLTIIDAIEEGRGIFDNVRKFVNYLLSANIAEVISVLLGVIFLKKLILSAAQLLFINIVTDGLPAIALGSDPAEDDVMRFKPHHFQGSILNPRIWAEMFIFGLVMSLVLLGQFMYNLEATSFKHAVSAAFAGMVVFELVRLVDIRTDYNIKWFSNPWLSVAILGSFLMQIAVLYVPALANIFNVGPISIINWGIIAVGSIGLYVMMKVLNPLLDLWMPETHSS